MAASESVFPKLTSKGAGVFKGKVLYIVVSDIAEQASAKGFDIYGIDFGGTPNKLTEDFRLEARERYAKAARVAQRDGVKWMVGELYIHHSCLNDGHTAYCPSKEIPEQQVADYYQVALEEFVKLQDPNKVGFVFDAYTFPAQKIKSTAAETIVKKYFSQF